MPMKLLTDEQFRSEFKSGGAPEGTLFKFATNEAETVDGATRTKRFTFSDATVDHAGDSVDPKGWDLGVFNSNPVALFAHMSWDPPIGRASNVGISGGKLKGDIEFAAPEVYEFADTIFRLVDNKFLKATSVGFLPKEYTFTSDKERPYGIDFKKQLLLEISVCPVPCNPNALSEARSLGIDTAPLCEWAEKVLDTGDTVFLPRKELETLRGQASGAGPTRYYISGAGEPTDKGMDRMRSFFKRWQEDPNELLLLEPGFTVRAVGQDPPLVSVATLTGADVLGVSGEAALSGDGEPLPAAEPDADGVVRAVSAKAGRRVSAATKAKLQEAMDHHDAATKCIKAVMDDAPDGDDDNDDPNGQPGPDAQPPGAVVVESDEHLTPEQRRVKEAQALRAELPTN